MTSKYFSPSGSSYRRATFIGFIIAIINYAELQGQSNTDAYSQKVDSLTEKLYEHLYQNRDSTYFYLDEIIELSASQNDKDNLAATIIGVNRMAVYYYDLKKLNHNLQSLDSLLTNDSSYQDETKENLLYKYSLLFDKGTYEYYLGNYRDSRKHLQQVIDQVNKLPDSLRTEDQIILRSTAFTYIAATYTDEGKYDLAKQYYDNLIRFILKEQPENTEFLIDNYNLLAALFKAQGNFQESNTYFTKVWNYYPKTRDNAKSYVGAGQNIVQNHLQLKQIDSAQYYLKLIKKYLPENHIFLERYHKAKGELHKDLGAYDLARIELEKALKLLKTRWKGLKHEEVAAIYNDLGLLHARFDQNQNAVESFNKAISQVSENNRNKSLLLKIFKNKAIAQNKLDHNDDAINTVEFAIKTLDTLKPTFKSHADKLVLIEDAFPLFESGLEAVYRLHKSSGDYNYINQAFDYAEKSKSVLLLEALLAAKATQFANIPDHLLARERQLKSEITYVEKQLNRDTEIDNEKKDQLFALKKAHRNLIKTIETDYKTYYDLKYNTKTLSLSEAQKLLKFDEKLISYFYGNEAIYVIGIDDNSKHIERIPISSSLENTIKEVHQMLGDSKSNVDTLAKASYQLYTSLIAPFTTSEEKNKLIIIADGLLNYIPFGALNTEENGRSYLTEKYAVSYTNSATLYAQLLDRDKKNGGLLAFAPSFSGEQVEINPSRDNLLPLPHNKREVEEILTSFEGQSFTNQNASLQNFTSQLSNYGILHLATHAVFDDASPEYSYLAFSKGANKENLLYVSDLYNLQINADLVTLSACETGVGELKHSEGFLSLARGFFYSGASSIASTLWKINDASTTTLMGSFYENLANGDTKDRALQKAQVSFLNSNRQNGLAHPYYWSGFIISGNTAPLTTSNYWALLTLVIILLVVAGFFVFRKEKD